MKRENLHIRDPFVLVKDEKYYLLGTTGDDPWGKASDLTLYESTDLENFTKKCVMVNDGSLDEYTNIWAPEMHEYNGKYYLIVSAFKKELGRGSLIFVSNHLDGNFKMLTGEYITPAGWGCLDATLFVYNGEPYLCFSNEWTTPITGDGDGSLFIAKLTSDLTKIVGKPKKIISGKYCGLSVKIGDEKVSGYVAEGPWLYEENGEVVLLWSTFTKTGYSVLKSVSKNGAMGDYEFAGVVFEKDGGHCMEFKGLDGKRYITLHQPNVTPNERMQLITF